MTAPSHTPGPWRAGLGDAYMPSSKESEIACVSHETFDAIDVYSENYPTTSEEVEANARLIAAAPDLLAALQGIDSKGITQATWDRAARAIAKATQP